MSNGEYVLDMPKDAMKFMAMYDSKQRSLKWSSNIRDGDCRDGDKILCNNDTHGVEHSLITSCFSNLCTWKASNASTSFSHGRMGKHPLLEMINLFI